ncbi:hypothetical protein FI667_g17569, partial [Globisporangium splendens]
MEVLAMDQGKAKPAFQPCELRDAITGGIRQCPVAPSMIRITVSARKALLVVQRQRGGGIPTAFIIQAGQQCLVEDGTCPFFLGIEWVRRPMVPAPHVVPRQRLPRTGQGLALRRRQHRQQGASPARVKPAQLHGPFTFSRDAEPRSAVIAELLPGGAVLGKQGDAHRFVFHAAEDVAHDTAAAPCLDQMWSHVAQRLKRGAQKERLDRPPLGIAFRIKGCEQVVVNCGIQKHTMAIQVRRQRNFRLLDQPG